MDMNSQIINAGMPTETPLAIKRGPTSSPSLALCTVLSNLRTPDVINTTELCHSLGIHQRNFRVTFDGKRVQRAAKAHGWTTAKARRFQLPGNASYLVRQAYLDSLFTSGITRRGQVWAGHLGSGASPLVAPIADWLTAAWLQGIDLGVLAA